MTRDNFGQATEERGGPQNDGSSYNCKVRRVLRDRRKKERSQRIEQISSCVEGPARASSSSSALTRGTGPCLTSWQAAAQEVLERFCTTSLTGALDISQPGPMCFWGTNHLKLVLDNCCCWVDAHLSEVLDHRIDTVLEQSGASMATDDRSSVANRRTAATTKVYMAHTKSLEPHPTERRRAQALLYVARSATFAFAVRF